MDELGRIRDFLSEGPWAIVGASNDRAKYGSKVLRAYQQKGMAPLFPVHPKEARIEGLPAFPNLASLPQRPRAVSIITPPAVTEAIVEEAASLGIQRLWMQPGAESPSVLKRAHALGLQVIAGGPCVLVALGYRE